MNTKVVYYSKSGNTKKIADAIAEQLGCEATNMDTMLNEEVDILFIGAAVYKFGVDKNVMSYVENIKPNMVKKAVIFATSAMSDGVYPKLAKALKEKSIEVDERHFYAKGEFMFMHKNHPNADDINDAKKFASDLMESL